ncbi:MAG: alanine--glyoxylate aminotransferase family protein [Phycisphaerales bacterium]|nr:alanine--glyoxylate aminotransferase family protein [Phycisphaerales bacterium]
MTKLRLFTPGPAMVPEEVLLTMARPVDHHRTAQFRAVFEDVTKHLQYLFGTKGACLTLTGSGTCAAEAAIVSCLPKGHKALVCDGGKFGERWGKICDAFGIANTKYKLDWGHGFKPEGVKKMLDADKSIDTVIVTHSETSTAAVSDVQGIAKVTRERDVLLIVDGITAVGAIPVKMDEWGVDVIITGSQKALMLPPGLGFVAVNDRAWKRIDGGTTPTYYNNLKAYRKSMAGNDTPFTSANVMILGLQVVLHRVKEEGLESIWKRVATMARATREAAVAMGMKVFAADPSDSVTALWVPEGVDEKTLRKSLRSKYGMQIAGGQDHLEGKIIRIGHMGYIDVFDALSVIGALELVLLEQRYKLEPGVGLAAAQRVIARG